MLNNAFPNFAKTITTIETGMFCIFAVIVVMTLLLLFFNVRKHIKQRRWEASGRDIEQRFKKVAQGQRGEIYVCQQLAKFPRSRYTVINNYPIYDRTKQAQVDHIVLTPNRVYVIETKTYSGVIMGNEAEYWWKQKLGSRTVQFHNPILQNYEHILYLRQILNVDAEFINLVAFAKAQVYVKTRTNIVIPVEKVRKVIEKLEKIETGKMLDVTMMQAHLELYQRKKNHIKTITA